METETHVYTCQKSRRLQAIIVTVGLSVCALLGPVAAAEDADVKKFTLINVLLDGAKVWLPSSVIVKQGETVELTLDNKLDAPHGFKIEALGIETVVQPKSKTTVQFTPDQAGIYPYFCQMHPPHIGGQLLVLDQ